MSKHKHKSTVAAFAATAVLFTGGACAASPAYADPPAAAEKCSTPLDNCHVYAHLTGHGVYVAKVKPPKDTKEFSVTAEKDSDGEHLDDAKEVYGEFVKQTADSWERDKKVASIAGLEPLPDGPDGPNGYYAWINKRAAVIDTKNPPKSTDYDSDGATATVEDDQNGDTQGVDPAQQDDPQANPQGSATARKQAWSELRVLHVSKAAESKDITTRKFDGKPFGEVLGGWNDADSGLRTSLYKATLDQATAMERAGLIIDSVSAPDIAKHSGSTDPKGAVKKANEEVSLRQKEIDSKDYTFGVRNNSTYDYDIVDGKRAPK